MADNQQKIVCNSTLVNIYIYDKRFVDFKQIYTKRVLPCVDHTIQWMYFIFQKTFFTIFFTLSFIIATLKVQYLSFYLFDMYAYDTFTSHTKVGESFSHHPSCTCPTQTCAPLATTNYLNCRCVLNVQHQPVHQHILFPYSRNTFHKPFRIRHVHALVFSNSKRCWMEKETDILNISLFLPYCVRRLPLSERVLSL